MASVVRTKRWSRIEYERLIDLGIFHEDERLELLGGNLVVREPPGDPHALAIELCHDALRAALGPASRPVEGGTRRSARSAAGHSWHPWRRPTRASPSPPSCRERGAAHEPGLTTTLPRTWRSSRPRKRTDREQSNARSAIGRRRGEVARTPGAPVVRLAP